MCKRSAATVIDLTIVRHLIKKIKIQNTKSQAVSLYFLKLFLFFFSSQLTMTIATILLTLLLLTLFDIDVDYWPD